MRSNWCTGKGWRVLTLALAAGLLFSLLAACGKEAAPEIDYETMDSREILSLATGLNSAAIEDVLQFIEKTCNLTLNEVDNVSTYTDRWYLKMKPYTLLVQIDEDGNIKRSRLFYTEYSLDSPPNGVLLDEAALDWYSDILVAMTTEMAEDGVIKMKLTYSSGSTTADVVSTKLEERCGVQAEDGSLIFTAQMTASREGGGSIARPLEALYDAQGRLTSLIIDEIDFTDQAQIWLMTEHIGIEYDEPVFLNDAMLAQYLRAKDFYYGFTVEAGNFGSLYQYEAPEDAEETMFTYGGVPHYLMVGKYEDYYTFKDALGSVFVETYARALLNTEVYSLSREKTYMIHGSQPTDPAYLYDTYRLESADYDEVSFTLIGNYAADPESIVWEGDTPLYDGEILQREYAITMELRKGEWLFSEFATTLLLE